MEVPTGPYADKYWCYKNIHAIILLAICDARGRFLYVNVGQPGSVGDAAAFSRSAIKTSLEAGTAFSCMHARQFPRPGGGVLTIDPFIVGDSAFTLASYMMRNYNGNPAEGTKEHAYDYCHIRTRCVGTSQIIASVKHSYLDLGTASHLFVTHCREPQCHII